MSDWRDTSEHERDLAQMMESYRIIRYRLTFWERLYCWRARVEIKAAIFGRKLLRNL